MFPVYDTKKLSSTVNREEESEFGLQRAETGDRRLSQNSQNNVNNDLRAAHSSDFFSGQRERGRDDSALSSPTATPIRSTQPRQSFRRSTTPRATPPPTQYTTPPPSPPQPSSPSQYEVSKRKLVRKRPVYNSTPVPTIPPNIPEKSFNAQSQQSYKEQQVYKEQQQNHKQQQTNKPQQQQQVFKEQQQQVYKPQQQQQSYKEQPQQPYKPQQQQQILSQEPYKQQRQQNFQQPRFQQQLQNKADSTTPDVPAQYREFKDEYVEVPRVTPKPNRYYPSNPTPLPSSYSTSAVPQYNKKNGLSELYNYEAQSTPGLNIQNGNSGPFNVKNSFSVNEDFARTRPQNNFNNGRQQPTTTVDYNAITRPAPTTLSYKNFNSVSYEPEKRNFVPFSKQNFYNPTTSSATTTTVRPEPPQNLNTIAYNTNIGFHSQSNFANPDEDDGQYRLPKDEDDGQYRPELYERELLSGAHSLNIAASGNRLPEDQQKKAYSKTQPPPKFTSQTAAPRPFRPAPTPTAQQTTNTPEYTTTVLPQTQRPFDLYQTYTTTSRPSEFPTGAPDFVPINNGPVRTTTVVPRVPETRPPRPQPRPAQAPTFPPAPVQRPTTPAPAAKLPNKEDASYDYAYYDSDPGFTEYDHIEEFGRTKKRA